MAHECEEADQFKALWDAHNEMDAILRNHGESLALLSADRDDNKAERREINTRLKQIDDKIQWWGGVATAVMGACGALFAALSLALQYL